MKVVDGLAVLTVLGAAGYLLVRNSLRRLGEVERTARAIALADKIGPLVQVLLPRLSVPQPAR